MEAPIILVLTGNGVWRDDDAPRVIAISRQSIMIHLSDNQFPNLKELTR